MFSDPTDVDPFHLNQRSENTDLFLLLEGYNKRLGFIKHMENKHRPIQYSLGYSPNSILCLCLFLLYVCFFLPNISNSHVPTLEHTNPLRPDPQQMSPQHETMRQCLIFYCSCPKILRKKRELKTFSSTLKMNGKVLRYEDISTLFQTKHRHWYV